MQTWVAAAGRLGLTLLVPQLAVTEVLALHPDAREVVTDLLSHPQVLLDELTADDRAELRSHLEERDVFDVAAAWVGHRAQQRGWSALSSDPVRLHRIFATLAIDPV